ncbi:FecR domain-containing protein [Niabella sp. CC-SYL272]|uniref:FecR family protein n=1 Tax=Niabella agricola TaxID=2891571 RepID=UPI001F2C0BEC|nr:FecR family protein [Niabella agricola]MCF3109455.1 FecR domain-containing protein [Niabella agricola]
MEVSKDLLQRFFSGACSPEEQNLIRQLLRRNPEKLAALLDAFRWEEETPGMAAPGYDEQQLYASLLQQVSRYERRRRNTRYVLYGTAAVITGMVFMIRLFTAPVPDPKPVLAQKEPAATHSVSMREYHNTGRQVLQIKAADGSEVQLYPGSKLRFPENFSGQNSRDFWLKGKAQFTVAKNKTLPFNVYSQNLVTTALGTVFIVDESEGSTRTRIRLLEGKIKISGAKKEIEKPVQLELTPNREIEINPVNLQIVSESNNQETAFDRGEYFRDDGTTLTFKNMALEKVVRILENNYHLRLQVPEAQLANRYYSGTFKKSDRVYEDMIREMNYLHKINILISKQ